MASPQHRADEGRPEAPLRPRRVEDLPAPAEAFRLLVLTPFPLRLDAPHGGRVTASLTLTLAERHRVALVCLRDSREPGTDEAIRHVCEVVEEVERPEWSPSSGWQGRLSQLGKLIGASPALVERSRSSAFAARLRAVEASFRPDLVHVEPHEMAQYLRVLRGPAKRVLVDHDPGREAAGDYSRAASGLRRLWRQMEEVAWRRYGHRTAHEIDAVVVFSERDRRSVESYARSKPIVVIPFRVGLPEQALNSGRFSNRILFVGGYNHPPNADAAQRLVRNILPCVRHRHAPVELELVGELTEQIRALAGEGVLITGRVESVDPHLADAAVVAIPIRLGGGMRVKVQESLAAGKAVVASSRAVEGLDVTPGRDFVLAETDEEFCEAIVGLLADDERRRTLGRAARRWAAANFDPERAAEAYEALYRRVVAADR
jgi:glycosyltransferase involved in cell wall biosynthesis